MDPHTASFVGGVVGGAFASFALHPLDVIKVRLQVHDAATTAPRYTSTVNAFKTIVAQEGVRGLFKGAVPGLVGASASWGLYFFFYEHAKTRWGTLSVGPLAAHYHSLAALEAGLCTVFVTNPLWLIKTRMQLQLDSHSGSYRGLVHALRSIIRTEGVMGLYKGIVPAVFLTSHGAVQFTAYEALKAWCARAGVAMDSRHYFVMGAVSKCVASSATYPAQVIKARLQQRQGLDNRAVYTGVVDTCTKIIKNEGVLGFYKGLLPNLYKVVPSSALTLVVYEWVRGLLVGLPP